jgi:hypothetical protein
MIPFSCVERTMRWRARFRKFPFGIGQVARNFNELINCTNMLKTITAIFRDACSMPNFLQFNVRTYVAKCAIFSIYLMLAFCNNNNKIDWLFSYKIIFILAPLMSMTFATMYCIKPQLRAFSAVCRKHISTMSLAIAQEVIVYTLNKLKDLHRAAQPFINFIKHESKKTCDRLPERLFKWDFVLICMTLMLLRCGDIHPNPG